MQAVKARVLIVDDDQRVRSLLQQLLEREGYDTETASDGASAIAAMADRAPDLVLLDVNMPGQSGFDVCRRIRQDATTRLTPVVIVTGGDARPQRIEGLEAGADDFLAKPVDTQELLARVRSLVRMKQYTDELDSASSIITTLATMIEARDGYGEGHCHRMANYATSLGRVLDVSPGDQQALYRGGFLHDIGMLAISDSVLRRAGPLDQAEFELVKSHTVIGDRLCQGLRTLRAVRPIIRSHHERLDGSGYPDGLKGHEVPLLAQIVGVVDVFEAVTNDRPYARPMSHTEAFAVLRLDVEQGRRRADIVDAFISLIESR